MTAFPYKQMKKEIRTYIESSLGGTNTLPIYYANAPELAADAAETDPKGYLAVHQLDGKAFQADVGAGNRRWRRPGVLQISVFVAIGKGTARSDEIVDTIVTMLRGHTINAAGGDIVFHDTYPKPGQREGAYWRVDVDTAFYSDDFDS